MVRNLEGTQQDSLPECHSTWALAREIQRSGVIGCWGMEPSRLELLQLRV